MKGERVDRIFASSSVWDGAMVRCSAGTRKRRLRISVRELLLRAQGRRSEVAGNVEVAQLLRELVETDGDDRETQLLGDGDGELGETELLEAVHRAIQGEDQEIPAEAVVARHGGGERVCAEAHETCVRGVRRVLRMQRYSLHESSLDGG